MKMIRNAILASAVVGAMMSAAPLKAEDQTYTVQQCNEILNGLAALSEGYVALDKDGKQVKLQYKLGATRIPIATNITLLKNILKGADDARLDLIKKWIPDAPDPGADGNNPEYKRFLQSDAYKHFNEEYVKMMAAPPPGVTVQLAHIKESDLKIGDSKDENPIPPILLSQLAPILDR